MPYIDFDEVKRLIPLAHYLGRLGWRPNHREPKGNRGWCPIHSSPNPKSRSFAVSPSWHGWCCHSCRLKGDVVALYAAISGEDAYHSALALCRLFGVVPPQKRGTERGTVKEDLTHG